MNRWLGFKPSKFIIRWWDCKTHRWGQREMKTPGFPGMFWTFSAVDSKVWLDFLRIHATILICKPSLWCSGNQVLDDPFFSPAFQAESSRFQSCFGINLACHLVGRFPSARMLESCSKQTLASINHLYRCQVLVGMIGRELLALGMGPWVIRRFLLQN